MTVNLTCAFPPVIAESYMQKKNKERVAHIDKIANMRHFDEYYSSQFTEVINEARKRDQEKMTEDTYVDNYATGMKYYRYEEQDRLLSLASSSQVKQKKAKNKREFLETNQRQEHH